MFDIEMKAGRSTARERSVKPQSDWIDSQDIIMIWQLVHFSSICVLVGTGKMA